MVFQNEAELSAELKEGKLRRAYLLYGSQGYLQTLYIRQMISRAVTGPMQDMNLHRFSQKECRPEELEAAAAALPFMSEKSCVILEDAEPEKLTAPMLETIEGILGYEGDSCVFVLAVSPACETKRNAKLTKLIKMFEGADGGVIELGDRSSSEMVKLIRGLAKRAGCTISVENSRLLLERCGSDIQALQTEVEKLVAYVGGGDISAEAIELVVAPTVEASVYELSRALMKGSGDAALQKLAQLIQLREPAIMIVAVLAGVYIDLYRARLGRLSGHTVADMTKDFFYKGKEFRIKNAVRDERSYPEQSLRRALGILVRADYALKSSRVEDEIILQRTLLELLALPTR